MLLLVGVFTFQAIQTEDCLKVIPLKTESGWGYDISLQGKIIIHQVQVPGISGRYSFRTKSDAVKTGTLVISKIRKKEIPSVSQQELTLLGVKLVEITEL
jgi:broad specificity polyphosphatase/5'/3'-nucleotidase SurE